MIRLLSDLGYRGLWFVSRTNLESVLWFAGIWLCVMKRNLTKRGLSVSFSFIKETHASMKARRHAMLALVKFSECENIQAKMSSLHMAYHGHSTILPHAHQWFFHHKFFARRYFFSATKFLPHIVNCFDLTIQSGLIVMSNLRPEPGLLSYSFYVSKAPRDCSKITFWKNYNPPWRNASSPPTVMAYFTL